MKNKTVAIFSAYIPPHLGGIERYVDNLTKKFTELGVKSIVVTSNYNNTKSIEEVNNITIIRLPVYNIFKNRYPIIKHSKEYRNLLRTLDKYNIDRIIVNTRFHLTTHIGVKYAYKRNIPVYLIEHGSNYVTLDNKFIDFFANRYEDFLTLRIKKQISGYYGVSEACGNWLKHFNINYNGVWYNSIDSNQKVPKRVKHNDINFLYAGRIIKQKGIENILTSFTLLLNEYDNINLIIAGDGPLLEKYKNDFSNKKIKFVGKLNYQELLKYYARTDVFLYPPLWPEGLPTSILEAGLMKCAVIGTSQGGIKEIINNGKNGLIVDITIEDLKKAMKKMIEDKGLRLNLADNLYNTILEKFSWDVTAQKVLSDIDINKKKKVLHLLPSNSFSGAENVVCTIIENNKDYDMYYCCPKGPIEKILKERKIKYIPITKFTPHNVKRICKKNNIDIIHAHDYKASLCAGLSGFKGKIISQLHVNWDFNSNWNLYTITYRIVMKKFYKIVAVSQEIVDNAVFASKNKDRFKVITNVVDKKQVVKKSKEFLTDKYDLIFVGRLEKVKNPDIVIEITKKLKKKYKKIKVCIIGSGSLEEKCRELILTYNLEKNIDLLGFNSNPFPYVRNSKIAILPSSHEGLPMSVIECMILDVPVLNSGVDGLSTLFENYPDYICDNIDEYCEKISQILDGKLNLINNCQTIIKDAVNMEEYISKVSDIYD